ncbi:MAG: hypothetical protein ACW99E_20800, partial [Promethearchaeota archaeon]
LLYCIFWVIVVSILREIFKPAAPIALTRFIPLNDILLELLLIFILVLPISSIIGVILGGYIITPLILLIHKKIVGLKMFYGIQSEKNHQPSKLLSKSFFPVLMAINLSSIFLTPSIMIVILEADIFFEFDNVIKIPMLTRFFAEVILLMITFGLAAMFFSPVWFLKDSGIVYTNKERLKDSDETFMIKSIGDWFQTIIRSYAGIGGIITYIIVIYDFLSNFINRIGLPGNVFNIPSLILWLGLPLYLAISLITALIINDLIKRNRVNYIRNLGKKLGIKNTVAISFELKKKDDR